MKLSNMPVIEGLVKYMNEDITPFHMPGHKNNARGFEELEFIRENLYKFDNTEVPGLDNMHIPEEMILKSQTLAADCFHAKQSYFLVNGSTCGIYSMIMGVTKPGDKIIVQRNCHRSVFMACLLGDLDAVYVKPDILAEFNIAPAVNVNEVVKVMNENPDAKAVVLTYPTYYGTCSDIKSIIYEAHNRNMLVLIDEAHGAHLGFNRRLPESSMELGADVSVISLHKSLPALTQSSLLNIGGDIPTEGIRFMLRIFQSTSPSYIFMASIDAARSIMENNGNELIDETLDNLENLRKDLKEVKGFLQLGNEYIGMNSIKNIDMTKIVIKSPFGGRKLDGLLRDNYKIQVEMSDPNNVVLISTIGDKREAFDKFYYALRDISLKYDIPETNYFDIDQPPYIKAMNMRRAYYGNKICVKLKESRGLVSSEMVVPYPPGIPVILPGEVITNEIINYIEMVKKHEIQLNGIHDPSAETILVVKE